MQKATGSRAIRLPARASLWYVISAGVQRGIAFFGTPIFTRLLTPQEYGLYPLYNTWLSIATVLATLEIGGSIAMRGLQRFSDRRDDYLTASLGLIALPFSVLVIVALLLGERITEITGLTAPLLIIMGIQILCNTVNSLYLQRLKYDYKYRQVVLVNGVLSLLTPLLSLLLIELTGLRGEGRIVAMASVTAVVAIPQFIGTVRRGGRFFSREIWGYLLRVSIPLLPHFAAVSLIIRIQELAVGRIYGTDSLARLSVAMSLGLCVTVITGGVISALGPWVLRRVSSGRIRDVRELLTPLVRALGCCCLIILAPAPEAIRVIAPPEYREVLIAVYPLLLSSIPMMLSSVVSIAETFYERSGRATLPSLAAAGISAIGAFLVLPHTDYRLAGFFILISYTVLFLLSSRVLEHMAGEPLTEDGRILSVLCICAAYSVLLFISSGNLASRVLLMIPPTVMLIKEGLELYGMIREVADQS